MSGDHKNGKPVSLSTQAGDPSRFTRRWCVAGAGLHNVWNFGDLELPAATGRLLLRGPNGTGKTTALESLAPYLLDLNAQRLSAGKGRTTSLSSLMREGGDGKRRHGYAWLTLAHPDEGRWSFGVRIQYSEGASPPVSVIPFAVPGRPLHELKLYGPGKAAVSFDQFKESVVACGGHVFVDEDAYVGHLATHVFGTPNHELVGDLAARLRRVRNPALLGDLSVQEAAVALRESLPGVDEAIIKATADALAESATTRETFQRDTEVAETLEDFRSVWSAHVTEVVTALHESAKLAVREVKRQQAAVKQKTIDVATAAANATRAKEEVEQLDSNIAQVKSEVAALEKRPEYLQAPQLRELKDASVARRHAATAAAKAMRTTADAVSAEAESLTRELHNIGEDLKEVQAQLKGTEAAANEGGVPLLRYAAKARPAIRAGSTVADPGQEIIVHTDASKLREVAGGWRDLATKRRQQAEQAHLAIADHQPVLLLKNTATAKSAEARSAAELADREGAKAKAAELDARVAAAGLRGEVDQWAERQSELLNALGESPWGEDELEQLQSAEPAILLNRGETWADFVSARAESLAANLRSHAREAASKAQSLRAEASELRRQATKLRDGQLLPFPRPAWAGPGNDDLALGAALDWQPAFDDPRAQALLEAALAASGLLGAMLEERGASTATWAVEPTGPVHELNLSQLVAVDASHPLAATAQAVLSRVRLVSNAAEAVAGGLCIGRDGTFTAGVLRGRAPNSEAPASYVGTRQRKAAAIARAEVLEAQAGELEAKATESEAAATELEGRATKMSTDARSFPSREALRIAETRRAEIAKTAAEARSASLRASAAEVDAQQAHQQAHDAWTVRTRAAGLPPDVEALARLRDDGERVAELLAGLATRVGERLAERLERATSTYSRERIAERLAADQATAQEAHSAASDLEHQVKVLEETVGVAIAEIVARRTEALSRLTDLQRRLSPSRDAEREAVRVHAAEQQALTDAERRLREDLEPHSAKCAGALRAVITAPGVQEAILGVAPVDDGPGLLSQIEGALKGRKTATRKTLMDRYDQARAHVAGTWSIDLGDPRGDLITFVLTYGGIAYTPIDAATYAEKLKQRAQQALAASEEQALREFVIGRLPTAIGTAWTRLKDWEHEVNRKMRSASASSGVGVQVRLPPKQDLPAATQHVFNLSCDVSDAERTPEQQRQLGHWLHTLIGAADAETMADRVAAAVDIRAWVDVVYEVTRPDGKTQRLGPRTGLSTGERRLVFLAPMIAAVAAAYDRLGPKVPRLLTLDEVPVEVDERGREGLARYIADLDLDLICTSYLWDGCPGAWDGIDAYDLEAGGDGTVVAFPMLVRGLSPVPETATAG